MRRGGGPSYRRWIRGGSHCNARAGGHLMFQLVGWSTATASAAAAAAAGGGITLFLLLEKVCCERRGN